MELSEIIVPDSYNTRSIPRAVFFADVANFVANCNGTSQAILELENKLAQYNLMFQSLGAQKDQLNRSIPSLRGTLEALDFVEKKDDETLFYHEIVNGLYVKAKVTDNKKVGLFLGSNIMVEYTLEEAKALIQKNITQVENQIADLEKNMEFLKEQITIIEVSVSRVFNYDVQKRKQEKAQ